MLHLERQNYKNNAQRFRTERAKLVKIIGKSPNIHHIGSTAIPNMSGKNILDILIGVPNAKDLAETLQKLQSIGYFLGKNRDKDYVFLASKAEETGSGDTHIHLTVTDSDRYKDFLTLKKYLLENPQEASKYRKAKQLIAKTANDDRSAYKKEKSKYVAGLLEKARCY